MPAIYAWLEQAAAGALMCYGAPVANTQRSLGIYTGRILKGEKAGDLPVQQVTIVTRLRLPSIYFARFFVLDGGLMSYGIDQPHLFRQAGSYVDRILRGTKPADLPAQSPTKFELVINIKTAKKLGLNVPDALLARADEVIE
jgi:putative ABC transport system substrate-binding protein